MTVSPTFSPWFFPKKCSKLTFYFIIPFQRAYFKLLGKQKQDTQNSSYGHPKMLHWSWLDQHWRCSACVPFSQVLCSVTAVDDTVDYYCAQNEENEDKNRYSQILPSKQAPAIEAIEIVCDPFISLYRWAAQSQASVLPLWLQLRQCQLHPGEIDIRFKMHSFYAEALSISTIFCVSPAYFCCCRVINRDMGT